MAEPVYIVAGQMRCFTNMLASITAKTGHAPNAFDPVRTETVKGLYDKPEDGYEFNETVVELEWCPTCSHRRWKNSIRPVQDGRMVEVEEPWPICDVANCCGDFITNTDRYRGMVINWNIGNMPFPPVTAPTMTVVMWRNYEEVRQSVGAMGMDFAKQMTEPEYWYANARFFETAPNPKMVMWGRDLVSRMKPHRLRAWRSLASWGWPCDPEAASELVDCSRVHFRVEGLEHGAPVIPEVNYA